MIQLDNNINIYYDLKYIPRQEQIDSLDFIKNSINTGNRFILCDIPTGVGKSYLNIMFINWYMNYINKDAHFDILTNSKILQEQYIKEFKFINNIKGQSNYRCDCHDTNCAEGKELNKILKKRCDECPYDFARQMWIGGQISLTNFHYFNTLAIFQKELFNSKQKNVLIIDEAHDFESVFCDYISFKITARLLKKLGFSEKEIEYYDNKLHKIKSLKHYVDFLETDFLNKLQEKYSDYEDIASRLNGKKKLEYVRYINNIESNILSIKSILISYKDDENNWVLDITINKKEKMYSGIELNIQPIWGYQYLNEHIWKHYDHIIFMSGTILNKSLFSFINGLDDSMTTYMNLDSPFDVKNRKIYYIKCGKMTFDLKEETFKSQLPYLNKILKKYENNKGIIHTANYELAEWINNNIKNNRLLFHDSETRDDILNTHMNSDKSTVLVSPSMTTGIDLKDDLGRFQIIMKMFYPNISSNKIKSRIKSKSDWYGYRATVDLMQAYGRIIRSNEDSGDTFILDSCFSDVLQKQYKILPKYFTDAIKMLK